MGVRGRTTGGQEQQRYAIVTAGIVSVLRDDVAIPPSSFLARLDH